MESKTTIWTGRILSGLPALLLLFSAALKLYGGPGLAEGFAHLGLSPSLAVPLAILEITCTLIYLIPRTSPLGAILLTGYMGGAVLTHLRAGDPFYMQVLVGVFVWGGLYLREPRLRELIPVRTRSTKLI
ncbi:MAG: DoxX family protein [Bryobacteraceae bacterium]